MRQKIDIIVSRILVFIMIAMTLDVLWGVFTRYAMGHQASWTEELARFLLIWLGVLGAAFTSGRRKHLAIDLLSDRFNPKQQKLLAQLINALIVIFAVLVLVIGGLRLMYLTQLLGQTSPALQVPMSWIYSVIPVSGLLIIYYRLTHPDRPSNLNTQ